MHFLGFYGSSLQSIEKLQMLKCMANKDYKIYNLNFTGNYFLCLCFLALLRSRLSNPQKIHQNSTRH